jgi:hypothetical protein
VASLNDAIGGAARKAFRDDAVALMAEMMLGGNLASAVATGRRLEVSEWQDAVDLFRWATDVDPDEGLVPGSLGHAIAALVYARSRLTDRDAVRRNRLLLNEARALVGEAPARADASVVLELAESLICTLERSGEAALAALDRAAPAVGEDEAVLNEIKARRALILFDEGRVDDSRELMAGLPEAGAGPNVFLLQAAHALNSGHHRLARERITTGMLMCTLVGDLHPTERPLLEMAATSVRTDDSALADLIGETIVRLERLYLADEVPDDSTRIMFGVSGAQRFAAEDLVASLIGRGHVAEALSVADDTRAIVLRRLLDKPAQARTDSGAESVGVDRLEEAKELPALFFRAYCARLSELIERQLQTRGFESLSTAADLRRMVADRRPVLFVEPLGEHISVFVVDGHGTVTVTRSSMTRRELAAELDVLGRQFDMVGLPSRGGRGDSPPVPEPATWSWPEALDAVHRALVEPVWHLIPPGPLVIVPPGDMPMVPWNAIGPKDEPLVASHPLSIAPSIAVLGVLQSRHRARAAPARALLIGDPLIDPRLGLEPLPGARAEVAALDQLLRRVAGDRVDIVLRCGSEASEREYRAHAGADLVHLACHAVVREPVSASGLYLAGGSDRLTPAEIAEIPLADALVFLSACDSGAGQPTLDGVIGMARSFLEAGARTVVMSAWTVDDLVAIHLVTGFYEELLGPNRQPVDMALAAAINAVRARLRDRRIVTAEGEALPDDPGLWAPLMVLGDGTFQYR